MLNCIYQLLVFFPGRLPGYILLEVALWNELVISVSFLSTLIYLQMMRCKNLAKRWSMKSGPESIPGRADQVRCLWATNEFQLSILTVQLAFGALFVQRCRFKDCNNNNDLFFRFFIIKLLALLIKNSLHWNHWFWCVFWNMKLFWDILKIALHILQILNQTAFTRILSIDYYISVFF